MFLFVEEADTYIKILAQIEASNLQHQYCLLQKQDLIKGQ